MDLESRLRTHLHSVDSDHVSGVDVISASARHAEARLRTRRRVAVGVTSAVVVVAGIGVAIAARDDTPDQVTSPSSAAPEASPVGSDMSPDSGVMEAPAVGDHWHAAFGIYVCGTWLPKIEDAKEATETGADGTEQLISEEYALTGVHTHGDGIIHYHPFSSAATGDRATLGVFLDVYDIGLTDTRLTVPNAGGRPSEFAAGDTCNGDEMEIQIVQWDSYLDTGEGVSIAADPSAARITHDGMVFVIAVVPEGMPVPMPLWAPDLPALGAVDMGNAPTTIPSPTVTLELNSVPMWVNIPADPAGLSFEPTAVWTGTVAIVVDEHGTRSYDPSTGEWTQLAEPPDKIDAGELAVWTGTELLLFDGRSGWSYDPALDEWSALSVSPEIINAETTHAWTSDVLLVWAASGNLFEYVPETDRWRATDIPPLVAPRQQAASVWTGTEWIVWGGTLEGVDMRDGAAYDPVTETWRLLAPSPLSARRANAVWTGSEMLVVAGSSGDLTVPMAHGDGAAYEPVTDTWRTIADGPAHPGFQPIWTGTRLLMFAKGFVSSYDPATDTWDESFGDDGEPHDGTPVWTGSQVLVIGAGDDPDVGGAIFTPPDP
jgi:hypothetical protein